MYFHWFLASTNKCKVQTGYNFIITLSLSYNDHERHIGANVNDKITGYPDVISSVENDLNWSGNGHLAQSVENTCGKSWKSGMRSNGNST